METFVFRVELLYLSGVFDTILTSYGAVCLLEEFCCAVSSLYKNCVLANFEAKRDLSLNLSFNTKFFNLKWKCRRSLWAVMTDVRSLLFFFIILISFRRLVRVLSTFVSLLVRTFCFLIACLVWGLSVIPALYYSVFRNPHHCTLSWGTWIQPKHLQFPFSKTVWICFAPYV
jgi:hypothetical protein